MATRRRCSKEFKLEAIKPVKDRGVSVSRAPRDLDLNEGVPGRWIKELAQDEQDAFPGAGNIKRNKQRLPGLKRKLPSSKWGVTC